MGDVFDVYAIKNTTMNCIIGWSTCKNDCEVFIKQRKLNKNNKIIYAALSKKRFKELRKLFRDRELLEYYGIIIFEEEEYIIDRYFDEKMVGINERASVLNRYNKDKRIEKRLNQIINDCKRDISYGESFNNIFKYLYDGRKVVKKIKELDTEYRDIIK